MFDFVPKILITWEFKETTSKSYLLSGGASNPSIWCSGSDKYEAGYISGTVDVIITIYWQKTVRWYSSGTGVNMGMAGSYQNNISGRNYICLAIG